MVSQKNSVDSRHFSDYVRHFSLQEKYPGMRSVRFQSLSDDPVRSFSYDTLTRGDFPPLSANKLVLPAMSDSMFDVLNQTRVSPPIYATSLPVFQPVAGFSLVRSVMSVSQAESSRTGIPARPLGWIVADMQMADFVRSTIDTTRLPFALSIRDGYGSAPE